MACIYVVCDELFTAICITLFVLASFTIFHIIPNMLLKIPNVIKSARVPLEMVLKNEI
jgi:hypothetical protein